MQRYKNIGRRFRVAFGALGMTLLFAGTAAGQELPRTPFFVYPTAAEAAAGADSSAYLTPLSEWERGQVEDGVVFTTRFTVPFAWANRQVLLRVDGASSEYEVRLNGRPVGRSHSGRVSTEFNLTRQAVEGANELTIMLPGRPVSTALEGAVREPALGVVYVLSQPTIRLRDVFTRTVRVGERYNTEVGIVVKTDALNPKQAKIYYELADAERVVASGAQEIELGMRREDTLRFVAAIPDTMLWSAVRPTLYTLRLRTQTEGRYTEYAALPVGFREVSVVEGRLMVNGEPVGELRAVAAGDEAALKQADADGVYVVAQAPIDTSSHGLSRERGGNPSNDPSLREAFLVRMDESYHAAKLHPSVVAFSIASGPSANGINLYEGYLRLKELERERPVVYPWAGGEWNTDKILGVDLEK